jgi:hypothetical protein
MKDVLRKTVCISALLVPVIVTSCAPMQLPLSTAVQLTPTLSDTLSTAIPSSSALPSPSRTPTSRPGISDPSPPTPTPPHTTYTPLSPSPTLRPLPPSPTPRPTVDVWEAFKASGLSNRAIISKIRDEIARGAKLVEVEKPAFALPYYVHEKQILKYFQLGEVYFALALRGSMNIYLRGLPRSFPVSFVGLLVASADDPTWRVFLEIQDQYIPGRNNPYYLWTEGHELFLAIVDDLGAGSGEGHAKVFSTLSGNDWVIVDCLYFTCSGPDDCFAFPEILDGLARYELDNLYCRNVRLVLHK